MIRVKQRGSFAHLEKFLKGAERLQLQSIVENYAKAGVSALASATPVDTGMTASSWDYIISMNAGRITITWTNSNSENGLPVVILIQYGHGTSNGGYVSGKDFINPAIRPIFDEIADKIWSEVSKL